MKDKTSYTKVYNDDNFHNVYSSLGYQKNKIPSARRKKLNGYIIKDFWIDEIIGIDNQSDT